MTNNLEDIARLAGVSRSTVSRVVNAHPNVSEYTRRRVLKVIAEQNFRPNLAARALVTKKTQTLSLVIPQASAMIFTDPYFSLLIQGIMLTANERNYAVMLWMGNSTEEEERFTQRVLNNSFFDALIIASSVDNDPLIPRLLDAHFPFLLVGKPVHDGIHYVDADNEQGAYDAVAHLLRLGYQRIGTITGPLNMVAGRARLTAFKRAHQAAERRIDPSLIVQGSFTEQTGQQQAKVLLAQGVDAIFAASDMMAIGALRAISEAGLRVPDDVALVGYDDLAMSTSVTPQLTTVRQPIQA
ncbi:MAG: LacI family transcriptional regulator, partial [Blastochloris sp.]|nr:LacI family transcriptional regulator [Blastochloris sp.]